MRRAGISIAVVLTSSLVAMAQVPGTPAGGNGRLPIPGADNPPPAAAAADPDIATHLKAWETVMGATTNFYAECSLVRKNLILRQEKNYGGSIMCLKPNMARMRIDKKPAPGQKPDPNDYTAYICTGREVYEYDGMAKQVTEFKLNGNGVGDNLLLEFMSGSLKAGDIIQRFDLALLKKEDPNWIFFEIKPRQAKDKAEFESMILVLFRPNLAAAPGKGYLPRTVEIRKNNNQEVETWDFPNPVVNAGGIDPTAFKFTPVPKELGWKFQTAQAAANPNPPKPVSVPPLNIPKGP